MPILFIIVFIGSVILSMGWVLLVNHFAGLLQKRHPEIYKKLGAPMTSLLDIFKNAPDMGTSIKWQMSAQQSIANMRLALYIIKGQYSETNDPKVIRFGHWMRGYFLLEILSMIALVAIIMAWQIWA